MKRFIGLSIVIAMSMIAPSAIGESNRIAVYFIPFGVDTYVPVTPDRIGCAAWEKWTISNAQQIAKLTNILNHGPKDKFDNNRIRMLILNDHSRYYVDQQGVTSIGHSQYKIDLENIATFRRSLTHNEIVDLKGENRCP